MDTRTIKIGSGAHGGLLKIHHIARIVCRMVARMVNFMHHMQLGSGTQDHETRDP